MDHDSLYSGRTPGGPHSSRPAPALPSEAAAIAALTRELRDVSLDLDHEQSQPMFWERKMWQRLIDDQVSDPVA